MISAAGSTIVSILTPPGRGAVAVITVEGPDAPVLVERFFLPRSNRNWKERKLGRIFYGRWGSECGEDVIVARRADDRLEIHCHGGAAAPARIVADLTDAGATEEKWPTWIARQERSKLAAAARIALAKCTTHKTAVILLDQYQGALAGAVRKIVDLLQHDSGCSHAAAELKLLLARAPLGLHLTQPWQVVIAGPPNVGKSSLINALLGYERAIVFDRPGTTRDVVTGLTALDGWPVELSDTAGLHATADILEQAGVDRAIEQAKSADLLLLVFDVSQPWSAECQRLVDTWPAAMLIHNKCDLPAQSGGSAPGGLRTSAVTRDGTDELAEAIVQRLIRVDLQPGEAVPFTAEQVEQLHAALNSVRSGDLESAKNGLLALLA